MKQPWKTNAPVDPHRSYVAVATTLTAHRLRATGRFFRGARSTSKQMAAAPGCMGFASLARPLRREYRSISLWESEAALAAFVHTGAHGDLVASMDHDVASFRAIHWTVVGADGRPKWSEAARRLDGTAVTI